MLDVQLALVQGQAGGRRYKDLLSPVGDLWICNAHVNAGTATTDQSRRGTEATAARNDSSLATNFNGSADDDE